jgi:hypothetical protein
MGLASGGSGSHDPAVEARVAKLESGVARIRSDISEIKGILGRLAPRIDEIYAKLPFFATKEDLANLRTELRTEMADLRTEIEKRPTRRQSVFDVFAIVGFIAALLAIGTRLAP